MHTDSERFVMPSEEAVLAAADQLRMLADPTRMKILYALMQGESSVACLAELAGVASTAVSQHLAKLRLGGLVSRRRDGTFIYYSVDNRAVSDVLERVLAPVPTVAKAPARGAEGQRDFAGSASVRAG